MRTILFVCTGNTCRSPLAEAIARQQIDQGLLGPKANVFVASAGTSATEGAMPTRETLAALADMGIDYTGRSKRLTDQMIRRADLVFTMTEAQKAAARSLVADEPEQAEKILMLDPDTDIEDPIGLGQEVYDSVSRRLAQLIPQRLKETAGGITNHSSS